MNTGSCLCGGIRFRVTVPLAPIQVCHCSQCRKAQGTAFATNIPVERVHVEWLRGESLLKSFEGSPGKWRVFCTDCGSPVYSHRASLPGVIRLRAGLLDEPVAARVGFHAHVASQCSWWPFDASVVQYPEGPP